MSSPAPHHIRCHPFTGQHLISALLERRQVRTLSWWMAENIDHKVGVSYIELDSLPDATLVAEVQDAANEAIRSALPVTVNVSEAFLPIFRAFRVLNFF